MYPPFQAPSCATPRDQDTWLGICPYASCRRDRPLNGLLVAKFRSHCSAVMLSGRFNERKIMNKVGLVVTAAAALMAPTASSNAQETPRSPESNGTGSGLCWDVSTNMILPDYRSTVGSAPSANPSSTPGSALASDSGSTVGSALSSHPSSMEPTSSKNALGTDLARPAGIPDC
jgi:hypothetical protein